MVVGGGRSDYHKNISVESKRKRKKTNIKSLVATLSISPAAVSLATRDYSSLANLNGAASCQH
jgi:hypothetical protein